MQTAGPWSRHQYLRTLVRIQRLDKVSNSGGAQTIKMPLNILFPSLFGEKRPNNEQSSKFREGGGGHVAPWPPGPPSYPGTDKHYVNGLILNKDKSTAMILTNSK